MLTDPGLTLLIAADSIEESAGPAATTATVTRLNTDTSLPMTVRLTSSDTTEATVPSSVVIPASQSSVTFNIDAIDDTIGDGTQNVTISGSAMLSRPLGVDTTFGSAGQVTTGLVRALTLQPDGKIVTASLRPTGSSSSNFYDFAVTRYHSNGTLDTSFGGTGTVFTEITGQSDKPFAIAIQSDGKIVVAGTGYDGPFFDPIAARYNPNGTLDTSFGAGGKVIFDYPGSYNEIWDVAIQPDGKILLGGNVNGFSVLRLNTDGTRDTTFGNAGLASTIGGRAFGIALQADGKVIVAGEENGGNSSSRFLLARYSTAGVLDTSFGSAGRVSTDFAGSYEEAKDVVIQPDGKIIAVGEVSPVGIFPPQYNFALARYHTNGALDSSFGSGGMVITDLGGYDHAEDVDLLPDGRIVVVGGARGNDWTQNQIALARYNANGSLESSLISSTIAVGEDLAVQPDGRIVVAAWKSSSGVLQRYDAMLTLAASDTLQVLDDEPIANDDSYEVPEDQSLSVAAPGVLGNDLDVNNGSFAAVLVSGPSRGTLSLQQDGSFTYTPNPNFSGTDSFRYKALAGTIESNVATVTITVDAVPDSPVALDDAYVMLEDAVLSTAAPGVLGNDSDADGDALSAVHVAGPSHGTLSLLANGSFTYTPDPNFHGSDSFQYKAFDGTVHSNVAIVTITVQSVQDPPVAVAGPDKTANETDTVAFDGSGSYDVDGDTLTYAWHFGDGTSGSGAAPTHLYADSGTYTVTLTVDDGQGNAASDSLVVTVSNLRPAAGVAGPASSVRGQAQTFSFTATDPSAVDQAAGFTFSIDWGDGTIASITGPSGSTAQHVYTANGPYLVRVTATDKDGGTSDAVQHDIAVQAAALQGTTLVIGGTTGSDTISVRAIDQSSSVALTINGISHGTFAASEILVYAQAGDDNVSLQSVKVKSRTTYVAAPAMVYGESGADVIDVRGGTGSSILLGGADADTLYGGNGRNLLIGGTGADLLRAGGGDDILIGGSTLHDDNLNALRAIRGEWSRSDVDYATRIGHLWGAIPGGLNGSYRLDLSTVLDDAAVDQLFGESGMDWFFYRASGPNADILGDLKRGETATSI